MNQNPSLSTKPVPGELVGFTDTVRGLGINVGLKRAIGTKITQAIVKPNMIFLLIGELNKHQSIKVAYADELGVNDTWFALLGEGGIYFCPECVITRIEVGHISETLHLDTCIEALQHASNGSVCRQ